MAVCQCLGLRGEAGEQRPNIATAPAGFLESTSPIGKPLGQNASPKHWDQPPSQPSTCNVNLANLPASSPESALVLPLATGTWKHGSLHWKSDQSAPAKCSGKLRGSGRRWFWMLGIFSDVYLKWDFSKKKCGSIWKKTSKLFFTRLQDDIPCTEHSLMFLSQYRPNAHSTRLSTSFLLHCFLFLLASQPTLQQIHAVRHTFYDFPTMCGAWHVRSSLGLAVFAVMSLVAFRFFETLHST